MMGDTAGSVTDMILSIQPKYLEYQYHFNTNTCFLRLMHWVHANEITLL